MNQRRQWLARVPLTGCYENEIDSVQADAGGLGVPIWGATVWQKILGYNERRATAERESHREKVGAQDMWFPSVLRSCLDGKELPVDFGIGRDLRLPAASILACHRYDKSSEVR